MSKIFYSRERSVIAESKFVIQWRNKKYCDVVLLFSSNPGKLLYMMDSELSSANILKILIEYLYTSKIEFTESNMRGILLDSIMLRLYEVEKEVLKYIKTKITVRNCIDLYQLANCMEIIDLRNYCLTFLKYNINCLVDTRKFLILTVNQVLDIIKNIQEHVDHQKLNEAIEKWISYDVQNRKNFSTEMFVKIKWEQQSLFPIVETDVENNELFVPNVKCNNNRAIMSKKILNEGQALKTQNKILCQIIIVFQYSKHFTEHALRFLDRNVKKWKTINVGCPTTSKCVFLEDGRIFEIGKTPYDNRMVNMINRSYKSVSKSEFVHNNPVLHHAKNKIYILETASNVKTQYNEIYYINSNCYKIMGNMNEIRTGFSVVSCNGLIYVVGGVNKKTIEFFNKEENKWLTIEQTMTIERQDAAVCSLNGYIFIFGGSDTNNDTLMSAEAYDTNSKTWWKIPDMFKRRTNALAVSNNGLIYVIGGNNENSYEVFDPISKKWKLSRVKMDEKWSYTKGVVLDVETSCNFIENMKQYIVQNE
ncbi:ring canal kelch homolog isoform X2 [Adelges cooleyi]|uniref:ring canal kelch homolog isoform X2 n=1 Tax=Adelges cooleyi TaxID=133065 RepID=UPI0021802877|nr:ring canal kelch homolog isoform X2 [Adelges cooleyi]